MDESQDKPEPPRIEQPPAAPAEPPVVQPQTRHSMRGSTHGDRFNLEGSEFSQWIEDTLGSESYGAPRVFDLFTMLAITLAFALLFTSIKLTEPLLQTDLPQVSLAISLFLTFTAIAQATLWGGKKPRLASIAAGPVIWLFTFLCLALQAPRTFLNIQWLAGSVCLALISFPVGYLAGGVVAGVFLLADLFRKRFMSGSAEELPANDDAVFEVEE